MNTKYNASSHHIFSHAVTGTPCKWKRHVYDSMIKRQSVNKIVPGKRSKKLAGNLCGQPQHRHDLAAWQAFHLGIMVGCVWPSRAFSDPRPTHSHVGFAPPPLGWSRWWCWRSFGSLLVTCPWSCLRRSCSQRQEAAWYRGSLRPGIMVSTELSSISL